MARETAEQKLLKIIEAGGAAGKTAKAVKRPAKSSPLVSIRHLNQLLILGLIACIGILGYEIKNGVTYLQQPVDLSVAAVVPSRSIVAFTPPAKSLAYFLDTINTRNIFKPYEEKVEQGTSKTPVKPTLARIMDKYKLVGIAWLDLPETASVMIENKETGLTQFLREGEKLDDVTVKAIFTDRVVFSYENEEITIKL